MAGSGVTVATDGASVNRKAAIWGNLSPKVFLHSKVLVLQAASATTTNQQNLLWLVSDGPTCVPTLFLDF